MSRVLYFDCFSGISGDMTLGALLDAGLPLAELRHALGSLAVPGYEIGAEKVMRAGIAATKFIVREHSPGAPRHPAHAHEHSSGASEHSTGASEHPTHAPEHSSGASEHPTGAPQHSTHAPEHSTGAPEHPTYAHEHSTGASEHPTGAPQHPTGAPQHPTGAPEHPTGAPEHPTGAPQHSTHAPEHSTGAAKHASHAHGHPHRSLPEIFHLIDHSSLSAAGRDRAKALFQRLAEAEAAIHQMPVEKVHLHEVGALDSIIDIVGTVFAMEWFGVDRIVASPLNVGGGMVNSAHGVFPVPAPATVKLLGTTPVYGGAVRSELVTPTGALIVTSYASEFGPIPSMTVEQVGYGAGERDLPSTPNVLRVLVGRAAGPTLARGDRVSVIECEIDDMNPQIFGTVMERLYASGALEVFYVPVQMKKNRPGTLLTVIAPPDRQPAVTDIIFAETTTIGLRFTEAARECLDREIVPIETPLGAIRFKVARRDGRVMNAVPEYDDCVRAADAHQVPVKEVLAIALRAYGQLASAGEGVSRLPRTRTS